MVVYTQMVFVPSVRIKSVVIAVHSSVESSTSNKDELIVETEIGVPFKGNK